MSGAHTPGPWSVLTEPRTSGVGHWRTIKGGEGIVIGELYEDQYSEPDEPTPEESAANARLIAAAPELLEALEVALDGLRRASRQLTDDHKAVLNGRPWGGLLIDNAEAAIAKARGEV